MLLVNRKEMIPRLLEVLIEKYKSEYVPCQLECMKFFKYMVTFHVN